MVQSIQTEVWDQVSSALEYPNARTGLAVSQGAESLQGTDPEADRLGEALGKLGAYLLSAPNGEPEERYTLLFDMKPVCALHVGWHIFSDTYARGALLAGLAGELNVAGVAHEHDLPDYLPTLLRLIPRLPDDENRVILIHSVLARGLEKIEKEMESSDSPWTAVLLGLRPWLEEQFPKGEVEVPRLRRTLEVISC